MTIDDLIAYCAAKAHAYIDYPYGAEPVCIRIRAGKRTPVFAQFWTKPANVTFRAEPMEAEFFRGVYPDVIRRGYYCPPVQQPYWNTVYFGEDGRCPVPEDELHMMLDHAYEDALDRLPKYVRRALEEGTPL